MCSSVISPVQSHSKRQIGEIPIMCSLTSMRQASKPQVVSSYWQLQNTPKDVAKIGARTLRCETWLPMYTLCDWIIGEPTS
ncbi:hypothetical protein MPTK1_3g16280 [Marchantia polymorpha subsp. ruderalis]|uniref:Uncharacterized protein n=2 Tax=Marchantia polymorpha TaxID=3197 RepID=A0AAF6B1D8_MARPO|nr:hypothetical protein MARPO_0004s0043 [Marchantia polymorpha]BBN05822.1 hypothetical protein Mp_3g16280 [Marchantia polymorpha subsp. ruderalis]|eukprot:PTQ48755.1 hypothetical protein MARPO_0004s0043 [Marchantia polymorpha]